MLKHVQAESKKLKETGWQWWHLVDASGMLRVCNLCILRIMGRRSHTEKYPEDVQM